MTPEAARGLWTPPIPLGWYSFPDDDAITLCDTWYEQEAAKPRDKKLPVCKESSAHKMFLFQACKGRITSSGVRLRLRFVCILGVTEEYRIHVICREIEPVLIFLCITLRNTQSVHITQWKHGFDCCVRDYAGRKPLGVFQP